MPRSRDDQEGGNEDGDERERGEVWSRRSIAMDEAETLRRSAYKLLAPCCAGAQAPSPHQRPQIGHEEECAGNQSKAPPLRIPTTEFKRGLSYGASRDTFALRCIRVKLPSKSAPSESLAALWSSMGMAGVKTLTEANDQFVKLFLLRWHIDLHLLRAARRLRAAWNRGSGGRRLHFLARELVRDVPQRGRGRRGRDFEGRQSGREAASLRLLPRQRECERQSRERQRLRAGSESVKGDRASVRVAFASASKQSAQSAQSESESESSVS
eukprot:184641-Rhodomonas_salina.1